MTEVAGTNLSLQNNSIKEDSMMTYEEIAADPILITWLRTQPRFMEVCQHATAVVKSNPCCHEM